MREHIVVNSDRTVVVPDSLKKVGIQHDHNVNTLTFDCPRWADVEQTIDMSNMAIYVNYARQDKTKGSSVASHVRVDEADPDIIHFEWPITRSVTQVNGLLTCLICVKATDSEGVENHHWNSEPFQKLSVGEGMEAEEELTEDEIDYITQFLQEINTTNAEVADVDERVEDLEFNQEKQGVVTKVDLDAMTWTEGSYITGAGTIGTSTGYGISELITLPKMSTLILDATGYLGNVAMIAKSDNTPLVTSVDGKTHYEYHAGEEIQVYISCKITVAKSARIVRDVSGHLDELEEKIGSVADLTTDDKFTVVAALNEVKSETVALREDVDVQQLFAISNAYGKTYSTSGTKTFRLQLSKNDKVQIVVKSDETFTSSDTFGISDSSDTVLVVDNLDGKDLSDGYCLDLDITKDDEYIFWVYMSEDGKQLELLAKNTTAKRDVDELKSDIEQLKQIVEALQGGIISVYGDIVVSETSISVDEGSTATFTVTLDKAPSENQMVEITTAGDYITISPSTLTFTPDNYIVSQTVTVTAIEDAEEGNKQSMITLSSANKTVQITINVIDNDVSIEWYTVTAEDVTISAVAGVNCITAISTEEHYLNFPADLPCLRLSTACETVKGIRFNDGGKAEWESAAYNFMDRFPNVEIVTGGAINLYDRTGAARTTMPFMFSGGATNIKEFSFYPIGLKNMSQMFKGMTLLEKVFEVPETVTSWSFAFNNCKLLHNVAVKSNTLSLNDSLSAFEGVPACTIKCNDASTIHSEIIEKTGNPQITSANVPCVRYFESLDGVSPKNINCFGDSMTHGINNINPYTYYLKNMLSTDEYLVYNVSQVGYTSAQIRESFMDVCKPCVKDIAVIWSGSNDENKQATVEQLVSNVQSLVNSLPFGVNYIVVGLITYQWSENVDNAFSEAFGEHFLNMHEYLLSESAFTNIEETPTAEDITAMSSGTLPPSLISNYHQTELGSKSTAYAIKEKLLSLSYIVS